MCFKILFNVTKLKCEVIVWIDGCATRKKFRLNKCDKCCFETKKKTKAWILEHAPKQVRSLCCCSFVHFQGPKHPLPFLSLLASRAGSLSWHSDIWCLCRNTLLSCRKEFTGPLIIARDSTDKYILVMVWSCIFSTLLLLFLYMPMHNLEKWNGLHC